jgi:hypothetical protein
MTAFPQHTTCSRNVLSRARWLMAVILATWKAEIWRTTVPGWPLQKSPQDPISTSTYAQCCTPSSQLHGEAQIGGSSSRLAQAHSNTLKNNKCNKGWQSGSSGSAPAQQVQSPEFKLQYRLPTPQKNPISGPVSKDCTLTHCSSSWAPLNSLHRALSGL